MALRIEGGLAVLGLALVLLAHQGGGIQLWQALRPTWVGVARGLVATVPMWLAFWLMTHSDWRPLVRLRRRVDSAVRTLFRGATWVELAGVSLLAGVGEEILFRGALQPIVGHFSTPAMGLVVASLLFGFAHCLSFAYFAVATVIGFYLGWLAQTWHDVTAPIVAHALYDFLALAYILRRDRPAAAAALP